MPETTGRSDDREVVGGAKERSEGRAGDDWPGAAGDDAGDRADERDAVGGAEERSEGHAGDDRAGAAAGDAEDRADE